MFDEQGDQLFAMTDPIAERIRKVGGNTLESIGNISRLQRVLDNEAEYVDPEDMLAELREDNKALATRLREALRRGEILPPARCRSRPANQATAPTGLRQTAA